MNTRVLLTCSILSMLGFDSVHADLVLSLVPQGTTTVPVGNTIDVDLVLTQTAPIITDADITVDGLTTAQVPLILTGAAFATSSISINVGFDLDFSSGDTLHGSVLGIAVTAPVGDPTSVTLGTYTFSAGSVGSTILTTDDNVLTQFGFGGLSDPGDIDSQIFGAETLTLTAVPEPSGFLIWALISCASGICVGVKRRFR